MSSNILWGAGFLSGVKGGNGPSNKLLVLGSSVNNASGSSSSTGDTAGVPKGVGSKSMCFL